MESPDYDPINPPPASAVSASPPSPPAGLVAPSIGRIVLFHDESRDLGPDVYETPAIVTRVHPYALVDLTVFPVGLPPIVAIEVPYSEDFESERGWRWPPRI